MPIGQVNLEHIASNFTRNVFIGNVAVGSGATTTTIPLTLYNPAGKAVSFSANVQQRLVGSVLEFLTGVNQGILAEITGATANSVTIESGVITTAPAQGDRVVILRSVNITVSAPENIAQVGGTPVPTVSGTPVVPVQSSPVQGTLTDRSGSITTGGTAQTLAPANTNRRYLLIQNPLSATTQGIATAESLFINFTTTAVAGPPSIELAPGDIFVMEGFSVSTELVSVIAATTGHKWAAKEM